MKTFLICPVRGHDINETKALVDRLEAAGWEVHWPPRDTDQNDSIGLRICTDNRKAIAEADVVHIVWNGESQGCLFDMGMAFAMNKPIVIEQMPEQTNGKSFFNMIYAWEKSI
jgi:nucleoside 2-deoxyribosyltransferase